MIRLNLSGHSWAFAALLISFTGCSDDSLPLVEVTGAITYRGKPVPNANITFSPQQGPMATGVSDAQGHFSLTTSGRAGAVPEAAKVSVVAVEEIRSLPPSEEHPEGLSETRSLIPAKYSLIATTPLDVQVGETGENHFDFQLAD